MKVYVDVKNGRAILSDGWTPAFAGVTTGS